MADSAEPGGKQLRDQRQEGELHEEGQAATAQQHQQPGQSQRMMQRGRIAVEVLTRHQAEPDQQHQWQQPAHIQMAQRDIFPVDLLPFGNRRREQPKQASRQFQGRRTGRITFHLVGSVGKNYFLARFTTLERSAVQAVNKYNVPIRQYRPMRRPR